MARMSGCRSCLWIPPILLVLLLTSDCSRPSPAVPREGATETGQTPFQNHETNVPETPSATSSDPRNTPGESGLPFQQSQVLPSGTLLTVSLRVPIIARGQGSNESFQAIVDEAVVVDGNTLIPRGATVSGRIESARVSKVRPDRGYVRLALESVHLGGIDLPIQTASLFARQLPQSASDSGSIRLEPGRRLTFRLSEAVHFGTRRSQADS